MTYKTGDTVSWQTSQGKTTGKIVEKLTSTTTFKKQKFNATPEDPYYRVKSNSSGAEAIHKEDSLSA